MKEFSMKTTDMCNYCRGFEFLVRGADDVLYCQTCGRCESEEEYKKNESLVFQFMDDRRMFMDLIGEAHRLLGCGECGGYGVAVSCPSPVCRPGNGRGCGCGDQRILSLCPKLNDQIVEFDIRNKPKGYTIQK